MKRLALARCAVGIAALGASSFFHPAPLLVWNATPSAPVGLYAVSHPRAYTVGTLVLANTPASVRLLAARRHYVPLNVPLVKRVAAATGDEICAHGQTISINGKAVAQRLQADSKGRELPTWLGCKLLGQGDLFLLMTNVRDSFDGRYFGIVSASSVIGHVSPIWTR